MAFLCFLSFPVVCLRCSIVFCWALQYSIGSPFVLYWVLPLVSSFGPPSYFYWVPPWVSRFVPLVCYWFSVVCVPLFSSFPVVRFGFLLISIAPLRLVLLGPLCFSIGFRFGFYCVPPCFSMAPLRFSIGTPSFSIVFYWGPSFYHWVSLRLLHRRNT